LPGTSGSNAFTIAADLGVKPARVWRWRYQYEWPARIPLGVERANLVTMAAKCWQDGLPRIDIALLCGVAPTTLDKWRRLYHWEKRKAGYRHGRYPELRTVEQARVARLRERTEQRHRRAKAAISKIRNERRWRCCDMLLDTPTCPTCQRRWPLCA
jgi:uncharacterized protein YjcR